MPNKEPKLYAGFGYSYAKIPDTLEKVISKDRVATLEKAGLLLKEVMGELEIYFDHTRQGPITEQRFLQEEQRYVELFYRLWAKSKVTIYTNLHDKEIAYIKQPLTPNEINLLDQIIQKTKPKDLDDWYSFVDSNRLDEIDLIVRLTLRDKISTC